MKLMERDPYAGVAPNSQLWFHIVDQSDTTQDPTGSSFRIDLATLQSMIASAPTLASVLATGNESIGSDIIMSSQDDIFFENNLGTFSTSISNNKTTSANYVNYLDTNDGHLITRPLFTSLTQNYLTKANSTGQLTPSLVYDNGSGVAIGTTTITGLFNVSGGMSYFKGSDSTSSNYALKVDNSSNNAVLYARNDRRVGVNTAAPLSNFHVTGISTDELATYTLSLGYDGMNFRYDGSIAFTSRLYTSRNSNYYFNYGTTTGASTTVIGGYFSAQAALASSTIDGVYSEVAVSISTPGEFRAIRGYAANGGKNYGGHFSVAAGTTNESAVYANARSATLLVELCKDNTYGVYSALNTNTNSVTQYAGHFTTYNTGDNVTNYAIYALANANPSGSNRTTIAGYFQAVNGDNNYAIITNGGRSGFGTTTPNASAIVEMSSTTQGFLPPRMTGAQAEAISAPATGLMVYATSGTGVTITTTGWWGYDGATWVKLN